MMQIVTKSDIIGNCDGLITVIVMVKFTQSPRPKLSE